MREAGGGVLGRLKLREVKKQNIEGEKINKEEKEQKERKTCHMSSYLLFPNKLHIFFWVVGIPYSLSLTFSLTHTHTLSYSLHSSIREVLFISQFKKKKKKKVKIITLLWHH